MTSTLRRAAERSDSAAERQCAKAIEIVIGVFTVILSSIVYKLHYHIQREIIILIVNGAQLVITGVVLVHTGRKPSKCLVLTTIVLQLLTAAFDIVGFGLMARHIPFRGESYYYRDTEFLVNGILVTLIGFLVLACVIGLAVSLFGVYALSVSAIKYGEGPKDSGSSVEGKRRSAVRKIRAGGHVELDEKLLDAGLRELKEETGLILSPDEISSQLLGLWESVYPPMLSIGLPKRHHVVTYMLLKSSLSHLQLQACLRPDPAEVSACVWVDASLVKVVVSAVDGENDSVQIPADLPQTISVTEVSPQGELSEVSLPVSVLCNRAPDHGEDIERVSTGTKFALELWLKMLEPHAEMG
ncbi:nucleoside diphosphate-linked moiety X motif 17 isoform X2 [Labeo rohita]|uniref:Nucleoside diphosphate-linked moiety X motif 17 isoform X2 n=1 Tax=Labeo rohita TaxID=84645 RepID=A0A498MUH3_LABRO|nr:nucleoside diphosphate-linked moiety X motif 17 isoform X2 [Labeo rohita]